MKYTLLAATLLACSICFRASAQTPGLIYDPSTTVAGRAVLDPNGDGYTSTTTSGWTRYTPPAAAVDQTASEIIFVPIPVPMAEPTSDLGPGPDCGFTDFVDSGTEDPAMFYMDAAKNLIFRFRIGGTAPNSKGYSVLIDTDGKFGNSGTNADPNYVAGTNPGFEVEINLQTNFGVYVYNVNGLGNAGAPQSSFNGHSNYQRSIAASQNCNNDDYFYDFFVPYSALVAAGIDTTTQIRMAIITQMNPQPAIGNNALSDIGGVNDALCGNNFEACITQVIDNYTPTCLQVTVCPVPTDRTACPSINSVLVGSTVSGTSSEAIGTVIRVYKNGVLLSPTTSVISGGTWTLGGQSFIAGDIIKATAQATGKGVSYDNCDITVVASAPCTPPAAPSGISATENKSVSGTGVTGATIKIYTNGGVAPTTLITASGTSNIVGNAPGSGTGFCVKTNGNTSSCSGGTPQTGTLPAGVYAMTQTVSGCESSQVLFCVGAPTGGTSTAPVATSPIYESTSATISGTSANSAGINIYKNGNLLTSTTANASGAWSVSGQVLVAGDVITALVIEANKCQSALSAGVTVTRPSTAPYILSSFCSVGNLTSVSGTSVEATGTVIKLYVNGTALGTTTTVSASGTWSFTGLSIAAGSTVKATATASGESESPFSTIYTVSTAPANTGLTVNSPITEGNQTVSGTGTIAAIVRVYIDGLTIRDTVVSAGGAWALTGLPASTFYPGASVYATYAPGGVCESPASSSIPVACIPPTVSLSVSPDSSSICSGDYIVVTSVNPTQSGVIYSLYNGATQTGPSKVGTGSAITMSSGSLTNSTVVTVKALKIGPTTCTATLTETIITTINARPDSLYTVSDQTICTGNSATITMSSSQTGVRYTLRNNSGNAVISGPTTGTGAALTFSVSPSSTTTYNILAEFISTGCTSTLDDFSVITVSGTAPTVTATSPASRCSTGTVTLGATASAGTLNWYAASSGGVSLGTGTSFTTPSISSTTTYYVDATNSGCTSARTAVIATVNTIPTVSGTTPASRCDAGTVTLGAVASAGTLNWYAASSGGTSLGTGTSFTTPSISASTTYYVDATNSGCTSARTAVLATVNTTPTVATTTPAARCDAGTVTLGATASAGTLNWYAASSGGASLGTGTSFTTPSISSTTTYYVDATNTGCTTGTRTAVVATVNTTPTVSGTTPAARCDAGTVTIGATASAGTLNWYAASSGGASLGTGTSFTTPSISTTTTYYVDATNSGCTSSRTAVVATVNTSPAAPTASVSTQPTCAVTTGTVTITAPANGAGITYTITGTAPVVAGVTNALGVFTGLAVGIYDVTTTNSFNCTSSPISLTVNTVPGAPTVSTTTPASRCDAGTVTLSATASAGTLNWYAASSGGASLGTGTSFTTPSISTTTTYYVDATNSGCTSARTAVVATVNTTPTVSGTTPAARCDAGTLTLGAAASAGTLNWYAASSGGASLGTGTSFTTPSISSTTTYYVDATNTGCTTGTRTAVMATVNTTPTVSSTTSAARCDAGTVTLGAVASAGTLNWYAAPSGGASLGTGTSFTTPSISTTTTYYVDATNSGCTTGTRTAVIATVNTTPTVSGTTPAARCDAGTVTVGAVASAGTLNWYAASSGGTSLGTGASFTTPSISASTTYYMDATNSGCTSARTAVLATVNTTPTVATTTPAARCDAGTVTLGATASAGTLNWYAASSGGASLGTGTSFTTPSISSTTTYYVDATNTGCTTGTRTAVVATVNTTPTVSGTTPAARCDAGTVNLGAAASAGTLNWYAASSGGASLGTGTSFTTPSISATTTYYVDATNTGCITSSRTAVVATVNTTPTVSSTTSAARCDAGTVTLGATASAGTLNWYAASSGGASLGTGTSFTTPSISTTTTYYVDATNSGCTSARTAVVATVNTTPTVSGTTPAARCDAGTLTLGATASAGTLNWYAASSGGASLGTGTSFTTPSISSTTTYYVDVTASGCTTASRAAVVATVNTTPTVSGTTPAARCDAGTLTLDAIASSGTLNWYAASSGGASLGTGISFTTPFISTTTTYYVDASSTGCTSARSSVEATINNSPAAPTASVTIQPSCAAPSGTVVVTGPANGVGITYTITGTNPVVAPVTNSTGIFTGLSVGNYDVLTTNAANCTSAATSLTVNPAPGAPTITTTAGASRCDAGTVTLSATASVGTLNWYAAASGGASLGTGNSFTTPAISSTTTYYVDANNSGCTSTRSAVVATINNTPAISATTPASRCNAGTVTLVATASAGTLDWYAAASGGAPLGTGTSFTTPFISATTTYYVDATAAGCTTGTRTAVTATVVIPTVSDAGTDQSLSCNILSSSLTANAAGAGESGMWTINSGTGGSLSANNINTAALSGVTGQTYNLTWTITNGSCTSSSNVSVIFQPCLAPVAANDSVSIPEDSPATSITVLANDTDDGSIVASSVDLDPNTIGQQTTFTDVNGGQWTVNASGIVSYTPAANYNGTSTITYTVNDNDGNTSNQGTIKVVVTPVNDAPVANGESTTINEDAAAATVTVLTNDNDIDDTNLTVTISTAPTAAQGTASVNATGEVIFTPAPDYFGIVNIIYQVCDPSNACDTAILTINVLPLNDAPVANGETVIIPEDSPTSAISVLSNDVDVDDSNLTVTITSGPTAAQGAASVNGNGQVVFTPTDNYNGVVSVIYQVCDLSALCDTAILTIIVAPVNDTPVANGESTTINEDAGATTVTVLTNDFDNDDVTLSVGITSGPSLTQGTASVNGTGQITFTPAANYNGTVNIVYQVCDTHGACDTAILTVYVLPVNDAPNANNDVAGADPGVTENVNVLFNDVDIEGNTLTVSILHNPSHGTATVNVNNTIDYTANISFTNGVDTLVYLVCDNGTPSLCDSALVIINVPNSNLPPVVSNETLLVYEDSSATVNVLANDYDPNGDPITVTSASGNHGTVNISGGTLTYSPATNYFGNDTITYSVCDNSSLCTNGYVFVTVIPVTDPPVITNTNDSTITIPEDTSTTICVNIINVDTSATTITIGCIEHGAVTLNGTCLTYTPTTNYFGLDTVCIIVCNATGSCDTTTVIINIPNTNDAPVAVNDTVNILEDSGVHAIPVKSNDNDPDGDPLSVIVTSAPLHGTANISGGVIYYTPAPDYFGSDTINYTLCDNGSPSLCSTAQVIIHVLPVNDAPHANADAATIPEDGGTVIITIAANDSDPENNSIISTVITSNPTNGTAVLNANGTIDYTPAANYNGTDHIIYQICDNGTLGMCDTAMVTIYVTPVNDPPVSGHDTLSIPENTTGVIDLTANDIDIDGDSLTIITSSGSHHGTGTVTNGVLTYTPYPGYNGTDTIYYSVCDLGTPQLCDQDYIIINVIPVNASPTANDDIATTNPGVQVSTDVSFNDYDADGDPLTVTTTTGPAHGTTTITGNTINYTPDITFTSGIDTVYYTICDNGAPALCDNGILIIYVPYTQLSPVAADDYATTFEDTPATVNVIANDYDPNNDQFAVTTASATHGTVTVNANGTITYTPALNYFGNDNITYYACDVNSMCDSAIVHITVLPVNDPPIANPDTVTAISESTVNIPVQNNDSDVDGTITTTSATATHGTTLVNPDGTVSYTSDPGYVGTDTVLYTICDNGIPTLCASTNVIIHVLPINHPPVANGDILTVYEDSTKTISIIANDTDPDGNTLSITSIFGPNHGTATVTNGVLTYTPGPNYNGNDTIIYSLCDNGIPQICSSGTVVITALPVNDKPVANNDVATIPVGTTANVNVLFNDYDVDGDPLSITVITTSVNGTAVLNGNTIQYTPNLNFSVGSDTVYYAVCDGGAPSLCDTAYVVVFVPVTPLPPVSSDDNATTLEDTPVNVNVLSNDYDPNIDSITVCAATALHGTVTIIPDSTVHYVPDANYYGPDVITYVACDGTGMSDTAIVTVTVIPVNDAPDAVNDTIYINEDTNTTIAVLNNDTDPEGGITVTSATVVDGTITVNTNGTIDYTPPVNYTGTDTINYTICDNGSPALCDNGVVIIHILPVDDLPSVNDTTVTTTEDSTITFCMGVNDIDGGANTLSVGCLYNGTVTISGNCITYTPAANFNGTDSLCVVVCNPNGTCDTATVTINVLPDDDVPTVSDTATVTNEDVPVTVCVNITDIDGGSNTVSVGCFNNGTATVSGNCITYTPTSYFNGLDSVCVVVCSPAGICDSAIVIIDVLPDNNPPSVSDTSTTTNEDTPVTVCVNITDIDGGNNIVSVSCLNNGTAVVNGNCITYTPNSNFNGLDSLCVIVCDNNGTCDTATVIINVTPVDDLPSVSDTATTTNEDTPVTVCLTVTDPDGGNNTVTVGCMNNGTATISGNCITYTPMPNFNGLDSVCVIACDGNGNCDTATVVINVVPVDDLPSVSDTSTITNEDTPVTVCVNVTDLDGGTNTISVGCLNNGTATVSGNCITYTPDANYNGPDSLCVIVCDNNGNCDTATVVINVIPVDDGPVSNPSDTTVVTQEDVSVTACVQITDIDGGINTTSISCTSNGTVALNGNCVTYTPSTGFVGNDTICVITCNGTGLCDTTQIVVIVTPVTPVPLVANDDVVTTDDQTPVVINILSNDVNPAGGTVTVTITGQPAHGTVVVNSNGTITYTPASGYCGTDVITYQVCNTAGQCDQATVSITVTLRDTDGDGIPDFVETLTLDSDNDGTPNYLDLDSDNDNLSDAIEGHLADACADTTLPDADNDGIPDYIDTDSDNDGIPDSEEGDGDCDEDGIPNYLDASDQCPDLIEIPEAFSPNGDGVNDVFVIKNIASFPSNKFVVYNRWGSKVFEKDGYQNEWDGRANSGLTTGKGELPIGTYYYILELGDATGKKFNGYIYLNK